jgi:magnesium transporter
MNEIMNILDTGTNEEIYDKLLNYYHPYEVSEVLLEITEEERYRFYKVFKGKDISEIISYLEIDQVLRLFEEMKPRYIVNIIQELDIDDAVDILEAMPDEERAGYLKLMDTDHRDQIKDLLKYKEDTAGSIMTTAYIEVSVKDTIEKAMKKLIDNAVDAETIDNVYVTDSKNTLVGVVSLREMILARKGQFIKDIMNTRVITVKASLDQEEVADIFKDYDFTTVPVVDRLNRMIGIITVDDIIDVIDEEAVEDYSRLAGISDVEIDIDTETVWMSAKKRLPWLLILSVLSFLTSTVIGTFESTLAVVPTIALFMPMILGMAGNTGTQALAVTIRGLNNGEFETRRDISKHLLREMGTGLLNGVIIGVILFLVTISYLSLMGNEYALIIGQVVSLSIIVSLAVSTLSGALIPIIINSFKIDPAVASGPFVTMIIDILALSVYFTLATILIVNTI